MFKHLHWRKKYILFIRLSEDEGPHKAESHGKNGSEGPTCLQGGGEGGLDGQMSDVVPGRNPGAWISHAHGPDPAGP